MVAVVKANGKAAHAPGSLPTVEECRRVIRERNAELRAVLTVIEPPLVDPAAAADAPLAGVPFVLKDVWDTAGVRTTGGSHRHRSRVPTTSAPACTALLHAGAVLLGKSNIGDMAFSAESDNHLIGTTRNPHDASRTSGGSTGGGAAAVAAGMAAFEWGTDFGGSIRIPAAFCGVVGLRLSSVTWPVERAHFPRVSPRFWPFLGMGPLARDVATCRRVLSAVSSLRREAAPEPKVTADRVVIWPPGRVMRRAWPSFVLDARRALEEAEVSAVEPHGLPSPAAVARAFDGYVCAHFSDLIGKEELSLFDGIVAAVVGAASRGRLDKRLHPKGAAMFALVALGRLTLFRDPAAATRAVESVRAAFRRVWERGALIVSPTTTVPASRHGRTPFDFRLLAFVKAGNLVDATALALPFGHFPDGLPRSLQILGPPGSEDAVLALASRLERLEPENPRPAARR
jgi:Asp-tRNA(Asn)/Glu-tRNA(Gln) amidotransferase A subunit family amidase